MAMASFDGLGAFSTRMDAPQQASRPFDRNRDGLVLGRLLANGDIAIGFFNMGEDERRLFLYFETLGIPDDAGVNLKMTDVITGEDFGLRREFVDIVVPKHDCRVFRCTPIAR